MPQLTIQDLINALTDLVDSGQVSEDTPIVAAYQPDYPISATLSGFYVERDEEFEAVDEHGMPDLELPGDGVKRVWLTTGYTPQGVPGHAPRAVYDEAERLCW